MHPLSLSSTGRLLKPSVKKKIISSIVIAASSLLLSSALSAGTKVAFIGDQGIDEDAQAVLSLIANEGTDLVIIGGDLGYDHGAATQWEANLDNALGHNFPVLTVVGNHENYEWPLYKRLIQNRINRAGSRGLSCAGDMGVKAVCRFSNIDIVQVSPGVTEVAGVNPTDDYEGFIRSAMSGGSSGRWRICSWHKNQKNLNTGQKGNSTGWEVYNACLDAGAMVAVAHEHAYNRSYLLSDFENQTVVHRNSEMTLEPGRSFVAVSGLGGKSVRPQYRGGDWWASIYTASQGATHGALFCSFEQNTADCYFKAVDGSVPDRFSLRLGNGSGSGVAPPSPQPTTPEPVLTITPPDDSTPSPSLPNGEGYVFSRTDRDEFRWIDSDGSGGIGSTWIEKWCAEQLGGASVQGDWDELLNRAPNIDSISNPCADGSVPSESSTPGNSGAGYVFSRTDKDEYRWVDQSGSGVMGNTWIDQACADSLGGASAYGDWGDLLAVSPGVDSISSPCGSSDSGGSSTQNAGYVFARTDTDEYRWIDLDTSSGTLGSTWIDEECVDSLGGVTATGDWNELNAQAPALDSIDYPDACL